MTATFSCELVSEHIERIVDPCGVAMYLVMGRKRCALLDTGCGCSGLCNVVESLTDLPVVVLLTHGHVDHAFGAGEYGAAYMNMRDLPVYFDHSDREYRERFVKSILGEEVSVDLVDPLPAELILPMWDGDVFDLGGIAVKAVALPGHTTGSMVMYVDADDCMLLGDACGPGTILIEDHSTSVDMYARALRRLAESGPRFSRVLRNHGTYESRPDLLSNVIDVCRRIVSGTDDRVPIDASASNVLPRRRDLPMFQAVETILVDGRVVRRDGLEGNVTYRIDKSVRGKGDLT